MHTTFMEIKWRKLLSLFEFQIELCSSKQLKAVFKKKLSELLFENCFPKVLPNRPYIFKPNRCKLP